MDGFLRFEAGHHCVAQLTNPLIGSAMFWARITVGKRNGSRLRLHPGGLAFRQSSADRGRV